MGAKVNQDFTLRGETTWGQVQGLQPAKDQPKARPPTGVLRGAMLVQYAACGAVIPFVSIWFRDRGLDYNQISHILMASAGVLLFMPFFWGMLADRFVPLNRVFIVINLLAAAALFTLSRQTTPSGMLLAFVIYSALIYPTFNLVNALGFHHLENPQHQFSGLRAWGSLGWIVPFLPISLWIVWRPHAGLDFTLYFGMGLCLTMAVLALFLPHTQPGARRHPGAQGEHPRYLPAVRQLLRTPAYLVVLVSFFLVSGSFALVTFYSPPFLQELGLRREWIGPAQAIGVVFEILLFQWQPALIQRWKIVRTILLGCLALVVRNLLFSTSSNLWLLALSYMLAGAFVVFYHIGVSVLVNHLAGQTVRATAQTMMAVCSQGLGPMFANWMAGRLSAAAGDSLRPVFLFATFLAMLATLLIAVCSRHLRMAESQRSAASRHDTTQTQLTPP